MGFHKQSTKLNNFIVSSLLSNTQFSISETAAVPSETLKKSTSSQSLDQFYTVELTWFSKSANNKFPFRRRLGRFVTNLVHSWHTFAPPFTTGERDFYFRKIKSQKGWSAEGAHFNWTPKMHFAFIIDTKFEINSSEWGGRRPSLASN